MFAQSVSGEEEEEEMHLEFQPKHGKVVGVKGVWGLCSFDIRVCESIHKQYAAKYAPVEYVQNVCIGTCSSTRVLKIVFLES